MLNKNTQSILKSLLPINNSIIISYPSIIIVDEFKSVVGKIDISKLEEPFDEFGIYDGINFLNALDLLEEPKIELKNNQIIAKDQDSSVTIVTSDPSSLCDSTISEEVVSSVLNVDSTIEFDINSETLNRIKKASSVFKTMDTLFIKHKENKNTILQLGVHESFETSQNTFSINIKNDIINDKECNLPLPLENILKLPAVDYKVKVKYNEKRDAYRVVFENDIYTFIVSLFN